MHDCYACGCACYCGGDIEDHHIEDIECDGCGCEEDEDDEWYDVEYCPACDGIGEGPCVCGDYRNRE